MTHLAQLNVGRLVAPKENSRVSAFIDNLDRINALAERMPGFVWRYQDESGSAVDSPLDGDPQSLFNLSVWENAEALETFVFGTLHKTFYERRAEWFEPFSQSHFVMWHIPEGHLPTIDEAHERLEHLNVNGDSDHAFGWGWLDLAGRRCSIAAE